MLSTLKHISTVYWQYMNYIVKDILLKPFVLARSRQSESRCDQAAMAMKYLGAYMMAGKPRYHRICCEFLPPGITSKKRTGRNLASQWPTFHTEDGSCPFESCLRSTSFWLKVRLQVMSAPNWGDSPIVCQRCFCSKIIKEHVMSCLYVCRICL